MKYLITGGAGFIGTNFIYYMLENHPEYEYVCLDKLTYAGNLANLQKAMEYKNFRFVKGDIADRKFVFDLFEQERFDVVVNFAAESHVDRSIETPDVFLVQMYSVLKFYSMRPENLVLRGSIKFPQMKCTVICHLIDLN